MDGLFEAVLTGTGAAVPDRVVNNDAIARTLDTDDAWIRSRTGIRERRLVEPGAQSSTDLAELAGRQALERAGRSAAELDLVVVATCTPDYLAMPACAPLLASRLGAHGVAAFDLSLACTGFVAALACAEQFVRTGAARCALVVGVDVMSALLDWSDRSTCVIFGDGAGAVVLERAASGRAGGRLVARHLGSEGNDRALVVPAGGSRTPLTRERFERGEHLLRMAGRETFRFAVTTMAEEIGRAARMAGIEPGAFDLVVPHQVNERIIRAAIERVGLPLERVVIDIDRYGNTSAGSVPIALHEALTEGRVRAGDRVCLVAFGAGLSWGSAVLAWT